MKANIPGNHFRESARSEQLKLQTYHIKLSEKIKYIMGSQDRASTTILQHCHPCILEGLTLLEICGDENCLFRSISHGVYGSEDHHLVISLLTAIEMASNHPFYDVNVKECLDMLGEGKNMAHDSYFDSMSSVYTPGDYMGLLHIFGISAALNMPILSYCPPTTSRSWFMSGPLNCRVLGRGVKVGDPEVSVM